MSSNLTRHHAVAAFVATAAIATVTLGHAEPAQGRTVAVTNCNDTGAGSLRALVATADNGDTVDLRALSCPAIYLRSGPIAVAQDTLTVQGPGWRRLTVSGANLDSVFRHSGSGALRLRGMTITKGNRVAQQALGGCVYAAGDLDAYDVVISHCGAHGHGTGDTEGIGGGAYAGGNLTISYSTLTQNAALGGWSLGGSLYANGVLTLRHVRVTRSNARLGGGAFASGGVSLHTVSFIRNIAKEGGGLSTWGPAVIRNSTIAGNTASDRFGGLVLSGTEDKHIVNSTISGNVAPIVAAGFITGRLLLANSTIAYNHATSYEPIWGQGGLWAGDSVRIESSIVANNTSQSPPFIDLIVSYRQPFTGSDNIIGRVRTYGVGLPSDTMWGVDPMLLPLADNGGRTQTHALAIDSPAINNGNNEAALSYDQRGPGFSRTSGARTDIGAFERQQP